MGNSIIVVPCYNEAKRLRVDTFRDYLRTHPTTSFLFVDDGSKDATLEVLSKLKATTPNQIEIHPLAQNSGKAEAVRQGLLHVVRNRPCDYTGYWDADLATPLDAIDNLQSILEQQPAIKLIMGSRVRLLGREIQRKAARHYLGRVFATFASMTLRLAVYDTQCGAKLLRVTPELAGVLAEPFSSKWIFDVELIARFSKTYPIPAVGDPEWIYEFPLYRWEDVEGSKLKSTDFLKAAMDLWAIRSRYQL
jgi:glycosyltransferase involved in cell wall biosynthesis